MRPLSPRAAFRCEQAVTTRCRCRCGGTLHGRRQAGTVEALAFLEHDDPHHIPASRISPPERPRRVLAGIQMSIDPSHPEAPERALYQRRT